MKKRSTTALLLAAILFILLTASVISCAPPNWGPNWGPWDSPVWSPFWGFPAGLFGLAFYFLPTIIAALRRHQSLLPIILVNFFAGWTIIGWIITLVWAFSGASRK